MEPQKRKILHCVVNGKDLFADWFYSLTDSAVRDAVIRRLMRVGDGNFGDHAPVGGGVWNSVYISGQATVYITVSRGQLSLY